MAATKITDHVLQALARRMAMYAETTDIAWFISTICVQIQELEEAFFELIEDRWLDTAIGLQLDNLGEILGIGRAGNDDDTYRIRLIAGVARFNSSGRPEEVISAFLLLASATRVILSETFPAEVNITAIGSFSVVGTEDELRNAMNDVLAAGVAFSGLIVGGEHPFVFQGYPWPEGRGFGTVTDPSIGGTFARLL
jgi:alkanesulfonate monooxygenase SsuD/methylene tetrahydromethanopterin reductase-like flavin-dependent oxidoreductase (luciferase family)